MTTNHSKRAQTSPTSLGEIGPGEGTGMKIVLGDLPSDARRLTIRLRPGKLGEYAPFCAALGGTPISLTGLEPLRIEEVR